MKLGIMQPYFFPYLGYFSLIEHSDQWVVFDTVQYIRHGWINRNRVLHPSEGWQYITVPLKKHSRDATINQIETQEGGEWRERLLRQLEHYRKRAPYYNQTRDFVAHCLQSEEAGISRLNVHILAETCSLLGIPFAPRYFGDLGLTLDVDHPGEWALEISSALGASEYVNPPGGRDLFDNRKFQERGIDLQFLTLSQHLYDQKRPEFIFGLSVIDALMFNTPEAVRQLVGTYELSSGGDAEPGEDVDPDSVMSAPQHS
jgi:hypothetical protein